MSPKSDRNDIVNGRSGRPPGSVDVSDNNNNVNDSKFHPHVNQLVNHVPVQVVSQVQGFELPVGPVVLVTNDAIVLVVHQVVNQDRNEVLVTIEVKSRRRNLTNTCPLTQIVMLTVLTLRYI